MSAENEPKSGTDAGLKRSIARRFNDILSGRESRSKTTDQRTARRLRRYKNELEKGTKTGGKSLTPLDVTMRVHELLEHGETLTSLRKLTRPRESDFDREQMTAILREMHPVYAYRADAYRFAGVDNETLLAAGIIDKIPARRGPRPKTKTETKERK